MMFDMFDMIRDTIGDGLATGGPRRCTMAGALIDRMRPVMTTRSPKADVIACNPPRVAWGRHARR